MTATFALLIGVQDYNWLDRSTGRPLGTSHLAGAANDVCSMAMLVRMMQVPAGNIRVLGSPPSEPNDFEAVALGRQPVQNMNMVDASFGHATKDGILEGLRWLSDNLQEEGSRGIVYYSGHSIVTKHGDPALCPSDVHLDPSDASGPGVRDGYVVRSTFLCAVDEIVGGDPDQVYAFVQRFLAEPARFGDASAWARECAIAIGVTPSERSLARFLKFLGNYGEGIGSEGDQGREAAAQIIRRAAELEYTPAIIAGVLHGDPLVTDDPLRNLISFQKAFVQAMRDIPEKSQVHIVLETCLKGEPGRELSPTYASHGMPFANGNMVFLSSCRLGEPSHLAVFDNRWHGAFTWALVSVLSQTAVRIEADGRSFDVSYLGLGDKIWKLLQIMGIEQGPSLWAQAGVGDWQVFGGAAGEVVGRLEPVRVEEEISAGADGFMAEVCGPDGDATVYGWFVRPQSTFTDSLGRSWSSDKEYWVWKDSASDRIVARQGFRFVRPSTAPSANTLLAWVNANVPTGGVHKAYSSGAFTGPPTAAGPQGECWTVTYHDGAEHFEQVAAMELPTPGSLRWWMVQGSIMLQGRILLAPDLNVPGKTKVTLASAERVEWKRGPAPSTVTGHYVDDAYSS